MEFSKDIGNIKKNLEKQQDKKRYEHTLGVSYTAAALAMRYGYDIKKAQLAGLLHDCAKHYSDEKILQYCEKYNISMTEVEKRNPFLLHAKLGAFLAMRKYHIDDEEIISAILVHTTGKPNMSLLDKIVYVSDYIEPNRNRAANLYELRKMAFENLDEAYIQILKQTIEYLEKNMGEIDDMTYKAYDFYVKKED